MCRELSPSGPKDPSPAVLPRFSGALGCRGRAPTARASQALARPRPTAHVDHIGPLGVRTGCARAQPPFSADSEGFAKVDTLDFVVAEALRGSTDRVATSARASAIISRHSRAMLQVSDHQAMSPGSSWWPSGVVGAQPGPPPMQ
ncbi:hypothetical protein BN1263310036 [Stenotrophomonas indicatrix]|nr:hypothetical protein BN1263310036 [Stenotrophomonas indicatrix]